MLNNIYEATISNWLFTILFLTKEGQCKLVAKPLLLALLDARFFVREKICDESRRGLLGV